MTTHKPISFSVTEMFKSLGVKSFGREDAAALLFKYIQRDAANKEEEEMARILADTVDGLPLALATIGGYINKSGSDLQEYTETIQASSNAWTASAVGPISQYEKTLETVFDIAIREFSDNARAIIFIQAFLDPDHIPEALFMRAIETGSLKFLTNIADVLEMVRKLRKRQLIR